MRDDIREGMLMCVKGHVYHEHELKAEDFTASRKRGWCPILACRMPLRRVDLVDRQGRAWTVPLV